MKTKAKFLSVQLNYAISLSTRLMFFSEITLVNILKFYFIQKFYTVFYTNVSFIEKIGVVFLHVIERSDKCKYYFVND